MTNEELRLACLRLAHELTGSMGTASHAVLAIAQAYYAFVADLPPPKTEAKIA